MLDNVLIDVPVPIYTPRLILRPPQPGDGKAVYEAKQESWAELAPWDIWTWGKLEDHTADNDESFCRKKLAKFILREDIMLLCFDKQSEEFIGAAGLHKPDWEHRIFMAGFWVRTAKTRQGYAIEAASALIRYAFEVLSATKFSTFHAEGNIASQSTIGRLGFEPEGILRRQHKLHNNGRLVDETYRLISLGYDFLIMSSSREDPLN